MSETGVIITPDQRLRVFVSSTLEELAAERRAVRDAVSRLRLVPVMFELGARPHPPREVYRAYLAQSQVFIGIYWQRYGWVAPGEQISGLEDEYLLSAGLPRLLYIKAPAPDREPRLAEMLARITNEGSVSYQRFTDAADLQRLVENDLAVLLSERFTATQPQDGGTPGDAVPEAGALPVPATPLVGREQEVAAVEALVRGEGVRLVTLTGPGGAGKTRLAVAAAGRLGPGFADGVRFIELAAPGLVIDILTALVDSSLVQPEAGGDEPRFGLLETIRQYALGHLRDDGAWQQAHDQHAAYYTALAAPAGSELRGDGQLAWLNRLETEAGNLSAALSWLMDQDQLDQAITFIWLTWRFWFLRGHLSEIARHGEKFLANRQEMAPHERALALSGTGFTLISDGDQDQARSAFEQSLPLFREAGDPLGAALAAAALGHVLAWQHDDERAGGVLEQARNLLREADTGERTGPERVQYLLVLALVDNFLGQIQLSHADYGRAAQLFTAGLDAARSSPDRFTILISLYDLALASQARGDLDGARGLLRQGLSLAAEAGDESAAAYYLEALAAIALQQDDPQRATWLLAAAGAQLQASGSGWLHAYVPRAPHDHGVEAELRSRMGDAGYEQAAAHGRSLTGARGIQQGLAEAQRDPHRQESPT